MEVMDSRELEQKEVLIGQRGQSQAMGVSDDAGLMMMLSTGFYAKPLRTMLQEIMFNAWDAHRMGNCQDKPFDIYLNKTTGLIIRDYGPGIPADQIKQIYGTYGHSTKRDNRDLTGGFGLGSKSPFSYCDSFTVTSMNQGKKNMYLVQKASDEFNGKPGITSLISDVDTEETGLMVTVPLKSEKDRTQAQEYIRDLLLFSGMSFNLHYEVDGDEVITELLEDDGLPSGAFAVDKDYSGVWAVYGGVRYEIKSDPEYEDDLKFLENLSNKVGGFFLGFPPNSLTPLPNREGLNLSDKTKENIKSRIEALFEQVQEIIVPAAVTAVKFALDQLISTGMDRRFIDQIWCDRAERDMSLCLLKWRDSHLHFDRRAFRKSQEWQDLLAKCPSQTLPNVWESLLQMSLFSTQQINHLLQPRTSFRTLMYRVHFLRFRDPQIRDLLKTNRSLDIADRVNQKDYAELIQLQQKLAALTGQKAEIRLESKSSSAWTIVRNVRGAGKPSSRLNSRQEKIVKALAAKKQLKLPQKVYPDRLWSSRDGSEVSTLLLPRTVVLAKTALALRDTHLPYRTALYSHLSKEWADHLSKFRLDFWLPSYGQKFEPLPGFVISDKKGAWEAAKNLLEAEGWKVILADEPVKPVKSETSLDQVAAAPTPKPSNKFPLLDLKYHYWSVNPDDPEKGGIADPKVYLWVTKGQFDDYNWHRTPYPESSLVREILRLHPKTVMLYNRQRESTILKTGAIPFCDAVDNRVNKIMSDQDRFRKLFIYQMLWQNSNFPKELLMIPQFQQQLGLPYLRTKQVEAFERDSKFLKDVLDERSDHVLQTTKNRLTKTQKELKTSKEIALVDRVCWQSEIFDSSQLKRRIMGLKRGELKVLSEKIIRFLRTV